MKIVWFILAVACVIYGILVMNVGSGTGFFLVWFILAAVFFFFAFAAHKHLWSAMPFALRTVLLSAAAAGLVFFVYTEAKIIGSFTGEDEKDLDVIIVLGAQVYENGPSAVLKYRLDKAVEYLEENENTVCIVSGGRGYNEPFPEAEGMYSYLISRGIGPERIRKEAESKNTEENMKFSSRLFDPKTARVGIVTNDFHMYRACRIANKAGLENVFPLPAYSTRLYLPSNLLREFFALIL